MEFSECRIPALTDLNEYQQQAVLNEDRACMVNACVGSGKTTVLTAKVRRLHEEKQVPYEEMLVLTFTNRAADEIRSRLHMADQPNFGTFHSVARWILNEKLSPEKLGWAKDFTVIEPEEEEALALKLAEENGLKIKYKNRLPKRLEQERLSWKNGGVPKYKDDLFLLFPLLEAEKKKQNTMSFANLLGNCAELLKSPQNAESFRYPSWVIVDEVQDCSRDQVELLKLLCGPKTHLFAVGDPNQMIYGFRGSDESLFYHIRNYFNATELSLPINYRSNPEILAMANRFRQYGTKISGVRAQERTGYRIPVKRYYDPFQEAELLAGQMIQMHEEGTSYGEIAVLYRVKEQSAQLEQTFTREGIPYEVRGASEPAAEEGAASGGCVHLMTLHASKGLEFDVVFIIGLNKGLMPLSPDRNAQEEEQRLLFVGLTRARKKLELSWYTNPSHPQAVGEVSPFISRLPDTLIDMEREKTDQEKRENLQNLRRQIREQRAKAELEGHAEPEAIAEVKPAPEVKPATEARYGTHAHYGRGRITAEDENTITLDFPGYGEKSFMKMFGEIECL